MFQNRPRWESSTFLVNVMYLVKFTGTTSAGVKIETPTKVFFCGFREMFKKTFLQDT